LTAVAASRPAGGALVPVLLGGAYVLLVHLAVIRQAPALQWLALVLLCAIPQYAALRAGRWRHWLLLAALAALLYGLTRLGGGLYALFLPPVVLPGMLLALFAGSLRPGRVPLVNRIAEASGGPLDAARARYCRRVTWVWVIVLAGQAAAAILLAAFAPLWLWSAVTNFANYALLGLVFVLEYVYRRLRFPRHRHQGFWAYLRTLARTRYTSA
jgi:uncharacterized membrane protein